MAAPANAAPYSPTTRNSGTASAAATCHACLTELCTPGSRRWQYPFTACRDCAGAAVQDSHKASCAACRAEAANPADRHFQTDPRCAQCGPLLDLQLANGASIACDRPGQNGSYAVAATLALLRNGGIVAIKDGSGFELCCDARNPVAIARLREQLGVRNRPLAIMAANSASLAGEVQLTDTEIHWLNAPLRPIVQLERLPGSWLPHTLAPGLATLRVMLPQHALHYLLFHLAAGSPAGTGWLDKPQEMLLVMHGARSGDGAGHADNVLAREQLGRIADAFLLHDWPYPLLGAADELRIRRDGSTHYLRSNTSPPPAATQTPTAAPAATAAEIDLILREHRHYGPVLGLVLGSYGAGNPDLGGTQLLRMDHGRIQSLGQLAGLPLAGADVVEQEPWRLAAALLHQLQLGAEIPQRFAAAVGHELVSIRLDRDQTLPHSHQLGALLDAVAVLLGLGLQQRDAGELLQKLESLAEPSAALTAGWHIDAGNTLDFRPLFTRLLAAQDAKTGSSLLHATLAAGLSAWAAVTARAEGLDTIVLAGQCWHDRHLEEAVIEHLRDAGFNVLYPHVSVYGQPA
ncbi:Kae1-like domain-containing protein [Chitinilyticum piscinae]|uniref:Sua5/YciO/YrdC/YwlC family protein n=1 Tax=Chitinilyticum piscinae TaxID=2866724 RepID=A0A8J7FIG1_9NEIS|nr:Sua5/YciO/YrdC/YwlC family protein [Chitinilyticum piscinae]MBE9608775.1 Sua5/YciO/YrdC/YwlC family protein [Chitinilyticum piscinae]